MENDKTPYDDRECPIYGKMIDGELCYETAMCMRRMFKLSSVPESKSLILEVDKAKEICNECQYSDMS